MYQKRHAYLIIAHNEPFILNKLIECIDDVRNDIFIHIDAKSDISQFQVEAKQSRLIFVERIDVRWGDYSLVEAEYILLETAASYDTYDYYHLLSGVDLPIKSQNYIHDFYDSLNGAKELVGYVPADDIGWKNRINFYYLFSRYQSNPNRWIRYFVYLCNKVFIYCQKMVGVSRKWDIEIKKGCEWFSITDEFCRYVLKNKDNVRQLYKYVSCCDELFLQTLLYNWDKSRIFSFKSDRESNLRMIDWERGRPYVWGKEDEDYELLKESNCLFARKFSSKYSWIIEKITQELAI